MKVKILFLASGIALATVSLAQPQVGATQPQNFTQRGKLMLNDHNYVGTIDQSNHALLINENELAEFNRAMALFERDERTALEALEQFVDGYQVSLLRTQALMTIGNYYFYHDEYYEALNAYDNVPENALDDDANEDLLYRRAYSYLQLQEYDNAKSLYTRLGGTKRYGGATTFYDAYIDYANGNLDDALNNFKRIDPTGSLGYQAQYYMCQIYYAKSEYDKTINLGKSLLSDNINDYFLPEINRLVGESHYQKGDDTQAKTYLQRYAEAQKLNDESLERSAAYALGVIDYRTGNYSNVVDDMTQVLGKADALTQSAQLYIGQSQLKLNNNSAAAKAFEKAAAMNFDNRITEAALYNYAVSQNEGARSPFDKSIDLFETFLNNYPNSDYAPQVEDFLVDSYMKANDYDKALASIDRIKKPSKKVRQAKQWILYNKGYQLLSQGDTKQAASLLKQSVDMGDQGTKALNESRLLLAETKYRDGKYAEAAQLQQAYVNSAAKNDPNYAKALYDIGYSYFQQRKYSDAKTAFQKAINTGSLNKALQAEAYNRIGDTQYYNAELKAAESSYRKAAELNKDAADYAMFQTAMMAGLNKNYSTKIEQIDELIAKFPSSPLIAEAMLEKANAQEAEGKASQAETTLNALVKQYPKSNEARSALLHIATLQRNAGNENAAIDTYKKIITDYTTFDEAKAAAEDLKLIYAERGQLDRYAAFLETVPGAPRLEAAEIDKLTFDAAEKASLAAKPSIDKMENYLKQFPNGAFVDKAHYYIGRYHYEAGNYDKALTWIDKALDMTPDAVYAQDALLIKSDILVKNGNNEEAYDTYASLADHASTADNKIIAQLGMMRTAAKSGKWSKVLSVTTELLKSDLNSEETTEVNFYNALAQTNSGKASNAMAALQKLSQNTQNIYGAQAAYELANLQFKAGDLDKAEKTLNNLIDNGTPHAYWLAKGFILLSDIYMKQGKNIEAREYLESVKSSYPGKESDIFDAINSRLDKLNNKTSQSKKNKAKNNSSDDN